MKLRLLILTTFSLLISFLIFAKQGVTAQVSFEFFVASDMRQYTGSGAYDTTSYFRGVAEKMDTLSLASFLFVNGDIDPVDLDASTEDLTWTIDQYLGVDYTWYPVVGNHELPGLGNESYLGQNMEILRAFDYGVVNPGPEACDETTFSFDHENSHFVILNEYCDTGGDTVTDGDIPDLLYNWLATDLSETSKTHIFVIGHEPAYPQPDEDNGRERHVGDSLDQYPENRNRFWALLKNYNVDAYFCGHTHNYSTYFYDNVWQIDTGHARGLGDTGTKSSFAMVSVDDGQVTYDSWRDDQAGGSYSLTDTITTYTIEATVNTGGTISPLGFMHKNEGTDQTFTITRDEGYHITDVVVDSVSQGVIFEYEFSNITSDHTISVTFDQNLSQQESCVEGGGTWVGENNECLDISETACINYGGSYEWCASACRYTSNVGCTFICIQVCTFGNGGDRSPLGYITDETADRRNGPKIEAPVSSFQTYTDIDSQEEVEDYLDEQMTRLSHNNVLSEESVRMLDQDEEGRIGNKQSFVLLISFLLIGILLPSILLRKKIHALLTSIFDNKHT
jgi:hypothetical protein